MDDDFSNTLDWKTPFLALCVWFAHFMISWALSVIFTETAHLIASSLVVAALAFVALALLWTNSRKAGRRESLTSLAIAMDALATLFVTVQLLLA